MRLGNFYCEQCGFERDEQEHLETKSPCEQCGGTFFVRKPKTLIQGSGPGWHGKSNMWDMSIKGLNEQHDEAAAKRKKEGDGIRREMGLGHLNVEKTIQ